MFRKKGFICNWWIATKTEKRRFVDIFSNEHKSCECFVVGNTHTPFYEMETSRHPVVKVTKRGVVTSSGRFYPFATAHTLYLMYLLEIHNDLGRYIAVNWNKEANGEGKIKANVILPTGDLIEDVVFDFNSTYKIPTYFCGFSKELQRKVVINTFDQKPFFPGHKSWLSMVDVHNLAVELTDVQKEVNKGIRQLYKKEI